MKSRLIQSSFFMLLMLVIAASLTFGQDAASVTWNLIGADSLAPTTSVGNVTGKNVTNSDTIAIIDTKTIPNSPISGVTEAVRWAPYVDGSKVSWGDETMQNDNRWIQFALVPNAGNAFITDSISIYLGASGTTDHIRANLYISTDPTFATKKMLTDTTGVLPYRDSLQHFGYNVNALVNEGDTLYFRVYPWYDGSSSTSKYLFTQYAQIFGNTVSPVVSIDSARKTIGDTITVTGVAISPNMQTSGKSYYIWDGTNGIPTYRYGLTSADVKLGDSVVVTGKVSDYKGLLEFNLLNDNSLFVLDSNAVLPKPEVVTFSDYVADPESYEAHLIEIKGLTKTNSSTWPTSGNKSIYLTTDGSSDSIQVFIAAATDIFNETEPTWPVDLIGLGSQYGTDTTGYEIIPRFISDFIEVPVVPVELTSFSAQFSQGMVVLSWKTATETNNSGFEVERSIDGKTFVKVGFVGGHGTTTKISTYTFTDKLQNAGEYYYRLKQIDYNGTFKYSDVVKATSLVPKSFSLSQNYPNPFNPSTVISYDLPAASKVVLKVYDILGNEVATLVNKEEAAGSYQITFNTQSASNHIQLSSGVYIYRIQAGNFTAIKKMMLLK